MSTPKSKLRWILNQFDNDGMLGIEEAQAAILSLIRELVPEDRSCDWELGDMDENNKSLGWNACRNEMLKRLEGGGHEASA